MHIPPLRPHPLHTRAITTAVHVNHIELPPVRAAIIRRRRRAEKNSRNRWDCHSDWTQIRLPIVDSSGDAPYALALTSGTSLDAFSTAVNIMQQLRSCALINEQSRCMAWDCIQQNVRMRNVLNLTTRRLCDYYLRRSEVSQHYTTKSTQILWL